MRHRTHHLESHDVAGGILDQRPRGPTRNGGLAADEGCATQIGVSNRILKGHQTGVQGTGQGDTFPGVSRRTARIELILGGEVGRPAGGVLVHFIRPHHAQDVGALPKDFHVIIPDGWLDGKHVAIHWTGIIIVLVNITAVIGLEAFPDEREGGHIGLVSCRPELVAYVPTRRTPGRPVVHHVGGIGNDPHVFDPEK